MTQNLALRQKRGEWLHCHLDGPFSQHHGKKKVILRCEQPHGYGNKMLHGFLRPRDANPKAGCSETSLVCALSLVSCKLAVHDWDSSQYILCILSRVFYCVLKKFGSCVSDKSLGAFFHLCFITHIRHNSDSHLDEVPDNAMRIIS